MHLEEKYVFLSSLVQQKKRGRRSYHGIKGKNGGGNRPINLWLSCEQGFFSSKEKKDLALDDKARNFTELIFLGRFYTQRKNILYLEVEEPAGVELDGEVDGVQGLSRLDGPPAPGVVAVALDVHHAVEVLVGHVDEHAHAVGQAVHGHLGAGESADHRRRRDWNWRSGTGC